MLARSTCRVAGVSKRVRAGQHEEDQHTQLPAVDFHEVLKKYEEEQPTVSSWTGLRIIPVLLEIACMSCRLLRVESESTATTPWFIVGNVGIRALHIPFQAL